jgi:DNA-binding protein H-NS
MSTIDLSGYNLGELKGLQHEIAKEIKHRQHQNVQKARQQILAIAQEAGVAVEELLAGETKRSKTANGKQVKPQYQNPADGSQTWTGRGRQPRWLAAGIASGKTLEEFRI